MKREDEHAALVDGVFLDDESLTQITRLFKIIDRDCNGRLDMDDFKLRGELTGAQWKKWVEVSVWCAMPHVCCVMWFHPLQLRDKFDYDGDGTITLDEVSGFWNVDGVVVGSGGEVIGSGEWAGGPCGCQEELFVLHYMGSNPPLHNLYDTMI